MIYLLLGTFLILNAAALVSIAAWYRRDRADLLTRATTAEKDATRLRTMLDSAESDLAQETRVHRITERRTAKSARKDADARVMALAEVGRRDFEAHEAGHACLPGIDAIRAGDYEPTDGPTPLYDAGVVVPMRKAGRGR